MQQVQAMDHPKVLAPLEMGREEGGAWLAFPWVSWQSLKRILAEGPLSPVRARIILRQLGRLWTMLTPGVYCTGTSTSQHLRESQRRILVGDFGWPPWPREPIP